MVTDVRVMFKKFLPTSKVQRYSVFFPRGCIILVFTLKPVMHIQVPVTSAAIAIAVS